jgi:nucleotide-binding universal stress UspA family protein
VTTNDAPIVVAIDGSDAALDAAEQGIALLPDRDAIVLVTVVDVVDADLDASGLAGGVMSPAEADRLDRALTDSGRDTLAEAASKLGLTKNDTVVLRGGAGGALCDFASDRGARAIVMGTRGRGGIKRAFLGSVSDYVVRNAPCPVIVSRPD